MSLKNPIAREKWKSTEGSTTIFRPLGAAEFWSRVTGKGLVVVVSADGTRAKLAYSQLGSLMRKRRPFARARREAGRLRRGMGPRAWV